VNVCLRVLKTVFNDTGQHSSDTSHNKLTSVTRQLGH